MYIHVVFKKQNVIHKPTRLPLLEKRARNVYLFIFRYSCEMMVKIVFDGQTFSGFEDCLACFGETGDQASHAVIVKLHNYR